MNTPTDKSRVDEWEYLKQWESQHPASTDDEYDAMLVGRGWTKIDMTIPELIASGRLKEIMRKL